MTITNLEDGSLLSRTISSVGTNIWTVTTGKVTRSSIYSIRAVGSDEAGQIGSAGLTGVPAHDANNIVKFEGDVVLNAPKVTPADGDALSVRDPFFIIIDFTQAGRAGEVPENAEYDGDSSTVVTLTKVTIDGKDATADVSSEGGQQFVVTVTGITSAEHTFVLNAQDEAGNTLSEDMTINFTVHDGTKFSVNLLPGWNLVSFPGAPVDADLDVVFNEFSGVSDVVTYGPSVPGGALSAVRDETGSLVGNLESIDFRTGYWVNSAKFKILEVTVQTVASGQGTTLPPTIKIVQGWNLIPVLDITGLKTGGDSISASVYLESILAHVARVYTFDTVSNS